MKSKKILLIVLGILLSLSLLVGISYAYYMVTASQTNKNRLASSCISVSLTNEKNDITLNNAYPITNSEGKKLTPYQFTITNTCNIFISYNVNLEMLEGTNLSTDYIKTMVNSEAPYILSSLDSASTTIDKSTESRALAQGSLGSGDSVDYALRLWMDENTPLNNDTQNKSLISKIVVVAQPSTYKPSEYVTTLHDAILVNEYGVKNVDNAISKIESKETPDLSQTAPIITWQEKLADSKNIDINKIAANAINTDDATSSLTLNDVKLKLYKEKDFDSTTGKYFLRDAVYVDPTIIDFSKENYYFSNEFVSYDESTQKLYVVSSSEASEVYKLVSAVKSDAKGTWHDVKYDSIKYSLNVQTLSEEELESDKSNKGLYVAQDDYGKSYYYRGNVKNNNVYFGGYYWQIVRINGDNSIRLLYNGTANNADGETKAIGKSAFNSNPSSPAYVGYMFGNNIGTREDNIKNNVDSTIKNYIDIWYENNILKNDLSSFLSDSGFCGDRSLYSGDGYSDNSHTFFNGLKRFNNSQATLICSDSNDLYTMENSSIGNKALKYPIGLLTYDELVYSGVDGKHVNKLAWTYSSSDYWTMTPSNYSISYRISGGFTLSTNGYIYQWPGLQSKFDVRPVINLKADVEISGGIGTVNDPYIIKTS